jgi:hypothetical protein
MIAGTLIYVAIGAMLARDARPDAASQAWAKEHGGGWAKVADVAAFMAITAAWLFIVLYVCGCSALGRRA